MEKGLFRKLSELIDEVNKEYESLPENLRKRVSTKGFKKTQMTSLNKINEHIKETLLKQPVVARDPDAQMTIFDFIQNENPQ